MFDHVCWNVIFKKNANYGNPRTVPDYVKFVEIIKASLIDQLSFQMPVQNVRKIPGQHASAGVPQKSTCSKRLGG